MHLVGVKKNSIFFCVFVSYCTVLSSNPRGSHRQAVFREHQRCTCMVVSVGSACKLVVLPPDHILYMEIPYYISWPNFGGQISFCVPAVLKINLEMIYKNRKKIIIIWSNFGILKNYDQQCLWTCL